MSLSHDEYIEELLIKYKKTGFITTHLMMHAIKNKSNTDESLEAIRKVVNDLQVFVDRFNEYIWNLIKIKNATEKLYNTFRFATEDIEFISRMTGGRILMTVSPANSQGYKFVSLLGSEDLMDVRPCGLQGLGAKAEDAYWLMEKLLLNFDINRYDVYTSDGVHIAS